MCTRINSNIKYFVCLLDLFLRRNVFVENNAVFFYNSVEKAENISMDIYFTFSIEKSYFFLCKNAYVMKRVNQSLYYDFNKSILRALYTDTIYGSNK